jgi:hypothetical protein
VRELQERLQPPRPDAANVPPTRSDAVTRGIRVRVQRRAAPRTRAPVLLGRPGSAVAPLKGLRALRAGTTSPPPPRAHAASPGRTPARAAIGRRGHRHTTTPPAPPAAAPRPAPSPRSAYVPSQSAPGARQFFFAYRVTISNEGGDVVMLKSRRGAARRAPSFLGAARRGAKGVARDRLLGGPAPARRRPRAASLLGGPAAPARARQGPRRARARPRAAGGGRAAAPAARG